MASEHTSPTLFRMTSAGNSDTSNDDELCGSVLSVQSQDAYQRFLLILQILRLKDEPFDRIQHIRALKSLGRLYPPLHRAAMRNDVIELILLVKLYREFGASINHIYCGYTALDVAVKNDHTECIRYLLQQPETEVDLSLQVTTTLNLAVHFGLLSTVEILLEDKRVDPNARDVDGLTAYLYAASAGRTDCIEVFIDRKTSHGIDIEASNRDMTASYQAAFHGFMPMIE